MPFKILKSPPDAMLRGSPLRSILIFGLPIIFGNLFQQFYSMVDSIIVGNFEGAGALAAVGSSVTVCNFLVMVCSGFTNGASVVLSQLFGADARGEIKATISTTLIFSTAFSIVLTLLFAPLAPQVAGLIHVPADILDASVTYMRIYCAGLIFLMLYNFFASVLRALGDSVTPLLFLVISSLLNIAGDLFFVVRLHMGVAGVAWATVLAQAVSVILCILHIRGRNVYFAFQKGEFVFSSRLFRSVLRMGVPAAIQNGVTNMGFVFVQSLVNSFSTVNIAAYTAAMKLESLSMVPFGGISQAFAVFTGQNIGAGDIRRTKEGFRKSLWFMILTSLSASAVIFLIGPALIRLFVGSAETEIIRRGTAYLRAICPFLVFYAVMSLLGSFLRGAGDSVMTMTVFLTDLSVRVFSAYALSLWLGIGFMGCAYAVPIGWCSAALLAALRYQSGKWKGKTVAAKTQ
ncbi:MAG: MATE family efflux transporter [Butyricicoccaceae bacterium]